jgi:hypothetical protein
MKKSPARRLILIDWSDVKMLDGLMIPLFTPVKLLFMIPSISCARISVHTTSKKINGRMDLLLLNIVFALLRVK